MKRIIKFTIPLIITMTLSCSKMDKSEHALSGSHNHSHVHTAPHGGVLVEIGNHEYNIELVRREDRWSIYILGAHAERFVRISNPSIFATWESEKESKEILFRAVENAATDEIVGNTSQFDLIDFPSGEGIITIPSLMIGSSSYFDTKIKINE